MEENISRNYKMHLVDLSGGGEDTNPQLVENLFSI
jgi:hypothetical protein